MQCDERDIKKKCWTLGGASRNYEYATNRLFLSNEYRVVGRKEITVMRFCTNTNNNRIMHMTLICPRHKVIQYYLHELSRRSLK